MSTILIVADEFVYTFSEIFYQSTPSLSLKALIFIIKLIFDIAVHSAI